MGDRHTGVGFDQLLIVEAPNNPDVDFRYRIFNADGSEVEQCGNGARCFARFVLDKRLTAKRQIRVETKSGIIELDVRSDGQIGVNMGAPRLVPAEIPFQAPAQALSYPLEVDGNTMELAAVSMGNPTRCCEWPISTVPRCMSWGRKSSIIRASRASERRFPASHRPPPRTIARLGTRRRETQACGTGACAAAVAAISQGWMDSPLLIDLPGGRLSIEWAGPGQPVMMTGPAVRVYEGQVRL